MPCLKVFTNLPLSRVPTNFVDAIIPVLSQAVGKPADKFMCVVSADCPIGFGGSSVEPGVVASLESIGNLGKEENKRIAADVTNFITLNMGVKPNRIFISFYDVAPQNIARNGMTVEG